MESVHEAHEREEEFEEGVEAGRAEERAVDAKKSRLNAMVAITVALLATFMAICKVKDDNIVLTMQKAKASSIDDWNYYQARNIRGELAQSVADQMRVARLSATGPAAAELDKQIKTYKDTAEYQGKKKEENKADAEKDDKQYESLDKHHDQFDLTDALLSIAVSLLAVTALTQKRWLYAVALVPTAAGVFMGLAGLLGWPIYLERLTKLLS
jgi:hypothetical protein